MMIFFGGCSFSTSQKNIPVMADSPQNAEYFIDGKKFHLENGQVFQNIPNLTIRYFVSFFNDPVYGDLNSDGAEDSAVILSQEVEKGKGKFFYVSVALRDPTTKKFLGLNSILLGDRIFIEKFTLQNQSISIAYQIEKSPETLVTRKFSVEEYQLVENTR